MKTYVVFAIVILLAASCKKDGETIPTPPPGPPSPVDTLLNWKKVDVSQTLIMDVWFPSKQIGIMLAQGGIYRSTNEGANWTKVANGEYANLFFLNEQYGFAQGVQMAYTSDGGATWVARNNPAVDFTDLFFTSPSTGYISGFGGLYKTVDTGKTWQNVFTSPCTALFFFDNNNGWVHSSGKFYKTTNGGAAWTQIADIGKYESYGMLQFTDATHAKFCNGNTFARSNDGGVTWIKTTFTEELYDLQFFTNDTGYLMARNEIFKTTDGGATWVRSAKIANPAFVEIHFTDPNNGWACGNTVPLLHLKQ